MWDRRDLRLRRHLNVVDAPFLQRGALTLQSHDF